MRNPIVFKLASCLLHLLLSGIFLAMVKNFDVKFFLIWSIPLTVGLAISSGQLLYFLGGSTGIARGLFILLISSLISLAWLYAFFALWEDTKHLFDLPLIFIFIACSCLQLAFLDYFLPEQVAKITLGQNALRLLYNPVLILSLFLSLFISSKRHEKEQYRVLSTLEEIQLKGYFNISDTQLSEIEDYLKKYRTIKTAQELHQVYKNIDTIYDGLADSITSRQRIERDSILNLDLINTIVTGIHFAHYEGDAMLINPDLAAFKKIAETTPEKSDDDFIEIMIATYGEEKNFSYPKWLKQTTDYRRGSSLLGDEIGMNILIKIQTALSKSKEFENELNEIREIILYDILQATCYEYDSPKIVAEINKIQATIKLSEEEKAKISARLLEFKHPLEDLQLGCEKKDCRCGG